MSENILEVKELKKYFPIKAGVVQRVVGHVKAVDGISFNIKKGSTFGLVGESGCGKTTVGRTLLRLQENSGGSVIFDGKDVFKLSNKQLRAIRPEMQLIFQDPYSSMNPRIPVGEIIGEGVREHNIVPKEQLRSYVMDVMQKCGLQPHHIDRYPHEFSGGQRQRICIARSIAMNPEVLLMDEPTSALDPISTLKIEELINELKKQYTIVIVTHNMQQAARISDQTAFFLMGELVEIGPTQKIFDQPRDERTEDYITGRFG